MNETAWLDTFNTTEFQQPTPPWNWRLLLGVRKSAFHFLSSMCVSGDWRTLYWDRREIHITVVSDAFRITKSKKENKENLFFSYMDFISYISSTEISQEKEHLNGGKKKPQLHSVSSLVCPWLSLKGSLSAIPNPELYLTLPFSFLRHLTQCLAYSWCSAYSPPPRSLPWFPPGWFLPFFCDSTEPCALFHHSLTTLYYILPPQCDYVFATVRDYIIFFVFRGLLQYLMSAGSPRFNGEHQYFFAMVNSISRNFSNLEWKVGESLCVWIYLDEKSTIVLGLNKDPITIS